MENAREMLEINITTSRNITLALSNNVYLNCGQISNSTGCFRLISNENITFMSKIVT